MVFFAGKNGTQVYQVSMDMDTIVEAGIPDKYCREDTRPVVHYLAVAKIPRLNAATKPLLRFSPKIFVFPSAIMTIM